MSLSLFILIWWKTIHFLDPVVEQHLPSVLPPPHTQLHWSLYGFIPGVGHVAQTPSGVLLSHERRCLAAACVNLEGTALSEMNRERQNCATHYVWSLESQTHGSREEKGGCQGLRAVGGDRERCRWGGIDLQLEDEWLLGSDVQCGTEVNSAELCAWKLLGAWVLSVSNSLPPKEKHKVTLRWSTCLLTWLWWPFSLCVCILNHPVGYFNMFNFTCQ